MSAYQVQYHLGLQIISCPVRKIIQKNRSVHTVGKAVIKVFHCTVRQIKVIRRDHHNSVCPCFQSKIRKLHAFLKFHTAGSYIDGYPVCNVRHSLTHHIPFFLHRQGKKLTDAAEDENSVNSSQYQMFIYSFVGLYVNMSVFIQCRHCRRDPFCIHKLIMSSLLSG